MYQSVWVSDLVWLRPGKHAEHYVVVWSYIQLLWQMNPHFAVGFLIYQCLKNKQKKSDRQSRQRFLTEQASAFLVKLSAWMQNSENGHSYWAPSFYYRHMLINLQDRHINV